MAGMTGLEALDLIEKVADKALEHGHTYWHHCLTDAIVTLAKREAMLREIGITAKTWLSGHDDRPGREVISHILDLTQHDGPTDAADATFGEGGE